MLKSEAPRNPEKCVDEMSKVYRYLLIVSDFESKNNLVTRLADIQFIINNIYLRKSRLESGIRIEIQVADFYLTGQMALIAIQTLIDNVVRHNIPSTDQTKYVTVQTTAKRQLVLNNNLQKNSGIPFNPAGLATLVSRYKLLFTHVGKIEVSRSESAFTMILPSTYI